MATLSDAERMVAEFLNKLGRMIHGSADPNAACGALWGIQDVGAWDDVDADEVLSYKNNGDIKQACEILFALSAACPEDADDADKARHGAAKRKIEAALRVYYYAQHAMYAEAQFVRARKALQSVNQQQEEQQPQEEEKACPCLGISHFETLCADPKATTGYQKLLLYMLYQAYHHQVRKCGTFCYRRIKTDGGHDTHAWEQCFSIRDFIYDMTSKEFNFDMWNHLTRNKGNLESMVNYLATCRDPQFPHLIKRRDMFSFKNGIYIAREQRFVSYESGEHLPDDLVASKYFDLVFPEVQANDWYEIPTPYLQRVMACQEFPEEACRWLYAFIGRMIYRLNDMDQWQVIPFLQGQAGTGKSTILMNVCKNLYDPVDVGVLSNNIEKKFGLSSFVDKYIFIAPEVRNDLGLDQAEFQSMVSGEDMCVAKKMETAEQVQWNVPGILAGNQVPNWSDNARSIARRIVVWEFTKRPESTDTKLGEYLAMEMAAIILKCNMAYHEAVGKVGRDSVAKHLPSYFKGTDAILVDEVDSFRNLLKSGKLRFGEEAYMPFRDFVKLYNSHCRENGFKQERVNKSSYMGPFFDFGASVLQDTREWPRESGCPVNDKWILGMEPTRSDGAF